MPDVFLHGLETEEKDAGNPRFVNTIDSGVIYLVGTAPSRVTALYPANQPFVAFGYNDFPKGLGSTGTLVDALNQVFAQAGRVSQTVVCNVVEEGNDAAATLSNILGSQSLRTGLYGIARSQEFNLKPKLLAAPGFTSTRPTTGVATATITNSGTTPYTSAPTVTVVRGTGDTTGRGAQIFATINDAGQVDDLVIANPGDLYTATPTVTFTGGGGAGATATLTLGTVANPVAATLNQLCNRYRAMAVVSGPNTSPQAAVDYRLDFDTDRVMCLDPFVKVFKGNGPVSMPGEAGVLGLQARIDYEKGFWHSPSNHVIEGVLGTHRPVEHSRNDRSVESQYLNKNHVSTVIRDSGGGWKLFGNRVMKSDPLHVFWAVRRSHDVMIESIELACEPYLDKPFSKQNLVDIAETVNRALRRWTALGATLGGRVWLDPTLNTAESLSNGLIYIHYDGEAPAPMEHIVFVFNRNTGYYKTVFEDAAREIARSSAAAVSTLLTV